MHPICNLHSATCGFELKPFALLMSLWDKFFFSPQSVLLVALYRIFIGLMLVQFVVLLWPDLDVWYGAHAVISQHCLAEHYRFPVFNLIYLLPRHLQSMQIIFSLLFFSAISLSLGYKSNFSSFLAFLCLVSIYHSQPFILHSGDTYLRQQLFWLSFSPAGQALSIEDLGRKDERAPCCRLSSPWAQRMMQFQFCLIYADSFLHKIQNPSWIDGSAIYYTSRLIEFRKLPVPVVFDNLFACQLLTWATLAIEFSLFTIIWIKPLRYLVLCLALVFHLAIDWSMNIPQFEWLMILSLLLFVDPKDAMWVWQTLREQTPFKAQKI